MLSNLQDVLTDVGNALDTADPSVRGGLLLAGAAAGIGGLAWRAVRGRRKTPERTKVNVDAPAGESVEVILNGRDPEK